MPELETVQPGGEQSRASQQLANEMQEITTSKADEAIERTERLGSKSFKPATLIDRLCELADAYMESMGRITLAPMDALISDTKNMPESDRRIALITGISSLLGRTGQLHDVDRSNLITALGRLVEDSDTTWMLGQN